MLACGTLLSGVALAFGWPPAVAVIGAMGFVLSSTAVIMKLLDERGTTATPAGQRAVSILLLEDLSIVPLLALVAFLRLAQGTVVAAARPAWLSALLALNEYFFQGHFPGQPIMPGVLMIEAMAQVAGILAFHSGAASGRSVYFMSIERAKFRKTVVPGDQLRLDVSILQHRGNVWKFSGNALVADKIAAEAEFTAMVVDKEI